MVTDSGKDPDFFKKGVDYHNKGDFKKAIEMYEKVLETRGLDKKTLVLLGNAYYMDKEIEKAEEFYKKALSLDPNYAKAHFNLGIIHEENKKVKDAIQAYKRATELDKDFGEAYANLGDMYKAVHDMENAIINYRKALEIDSNIENAKEGLRGIPKYLIEKAKNRELINRSDELVREGIVLEKEGKIEQATKKYEEAFKLFPKSAAGLFLLKLSSKSPKASVVSKDEIGFIELKTSLICDTISPEVGEFLGMKFGGVDFGQKNMEYFFNRFKEIVREQEGSEVDLHKTSRLILFDEPEQELSKALKLELKGDIEGAKKKYEEVLKKAPYLTHAYYLYGTFLELNEQENQAFTIYDRATQNNFDYLDDRMKADIVGFFSSRDNYAYLKEIDTVSILREFLESTQKEGSISLLRFIKYKLALEAEDKIKYGFEKEESGESMEAISAYEDAINIDPTNPLGHYVLGLAYETRGLEKEAMEAYERTKGADFSGIESSEDVSTVIEDYLGKTTKDGHRVGTILGRYFEIIAEDPEQMLELLGFIEDLKIESISKIIKSYISTDLILGTEGKVVRDQLDFGGEGKGTEGELGGGGNGEEGEGGTRAGGKGMGAEGKGGTRAGGKGMGAEGKGGIGIGKVVRDQFDFGEDLDKEKGKIEKSKEVSKIPFELLWKYKTSRSIRSEAYSSDGKWILAGSENGIIYLIDRNAGSPWRYDSGASIVDIDISPNGKYGVFCNSDHTVELLDCTLEGKSLWKKNMGKTGVNSIAISSSSDTIAVSTNNFEIIFFDLEGNQRHSHKMNEIIKRLDITDDGGIILAASDQNIYSIKDKATPKMLDAFKINENIQSISLSKKGDLIVVGTREGGVYLLDDTGSILWDNNILNPVYGVSVSSDGKVVSGAMNGRLVLYSKEGEEMWRYQTGENIWDADISEKGDRIVSGCGLVFGNIYLFKLE
jgi:tetratricopeptide (TPR) repeat protein